MTASHAIDGHLLVVRQALHLNPALWLRVRSMLASLWSETGYPTVSVPSELVLASGLGARADTPVGYAVLTWVLRGAVEVHFAEDETMSGVAGDLLYWPASHRPTVTYQGGCLTLRLLIPTGGHLPTGEVRDLLGRMTQKRAGLMAAPYLPYPPVYEADGSLPTMPSLRTAALNLQASSNDIHAEWTLLVMFAKCVSAGGLQPVPAAASDVELQDDQKLALATDVIRLPSSRGSSIWAANGHAFSIRGAFADQMLKELHTSEYLTIGGLVRLSGANARDGRHLLRRLHALRAVDVISAQGD
ncbi:hypothetical protein [Embleya sp. NPDC001921]